MTGSTLPWVAIRYRTKRGAKQKVTVVDLHGQVSRIIADLQEHGCHSITTEEVKR